VESETKTTQSRQELFASAINHLEQSALHLREGGRQVLLAIQEMEQVFLKVLQALEGNSLEPWRTLILGISLIYKITEWISLKIPPLNGEEELYRFRLDTLSVFRDLLSGEILHLEKKGETERISGLLYALSLLDQEIEKIQVEMQERGRKNYEDTYTEIPVEEPTSL
jgi:hypothetical protein